MIFENIIYQDYLSEIENEWKVHFENALLGQVISEVAAAYRMILEKSFQNPCKVLQLPTDFHSYLYNGIPSLKLRKNVWNYIRRIEREASVNYRRQIVLEDVVSARYFHVTNCAQVLLKIAVKN